MLAAGELLRDDAIDAVQTSHAEWCTLVAKLVTAFASGAEFTTDDLWNLLEHAPPSEPRAMGAVIREARKSKLIAATGRYEKSTRARCHARPVAIWRRC